MSPAPCSEDVPSYGGRACYRHVHSRATSVQARFTCSATIWNRGRRVTGEREDPRGGCLRRGWRGGLLLQAVVQPGRFRIARRLFALVPHRCQG
eukprot:6212885-Pleurochrysis_carterae.AAC.3